ncbi:hypothetical protein H6F71_12910 [Microcoleus sp. FACHB-61]|uniref:hypothetical protein n=1 Tax=Microcoleus vaginatus TaxID=119532 RepID=UPI001988C40D|nr:hypothetical protein [Microcoleus sp. FACHB-61]
MNVGESFFDLVIGNWDVERRRKFGNEECTRFNGLNGWILKEEVKIQKSEVREKKQLSVYL